MTRFTHLRVQGIEQAGSEELDGFSHGVSLLSGNPAIVSPLLLYGNLGSLGWTGFSQERGLGVRRRFPRPATARESTTYVVVRL